MFDTVLRTMKQMAEAGLKERTSFRSLWFREWADLFLKAYEPGRKVVATSIYAFPMEILHAFDVAPFDFEIAGVLMSIANMGVPLMEEAEGRGYSRDICSFHRTALGGHFKSLFPEPDLLLTTSFYCDGKIKTNDILSHLWGKDSYLVNVPQTVSRESLRYVESQLRQAAAKIGEVTGRKLDEDRLKEAVRNANRSRRLQLEIHELLKNRPIAFSPKDLIGYSINGQLFWGSPVKALLEEQLMRDLKHRLASGEKRPERHRLYWCAWMPVYTSDLFGILKENQVSVAMCETYRVFWDEIDEQKPFEGLAMKCLRNPFIGPTSRRMEGMEGMVRDFGIDGAILFATPACRHSNSAHLLLRDAFSRFGVPFLTLDMDIADPRGYMPEQVRTRLESFIEVMDNNY